MYIPHDSIGDTNMRWKRTVVRIKGADGRRSPLLVQEILDVNKEEVSLIGSLNTEEGWIPVRKTFKISDMDLSFPMFGYYNNGPNTYLLARVARDRTYTLGFTDRRVSFRCPNPDEAMYLGFQADISPLDVMPHLYSREYPSVAEAHKRVLSGKYLSVGVSKTIALAVSRYSANVSLYRNNKFIGELDEKNVAVLKYPHRYFSEEVSELGLEVVFKKEA